MPTEMAATGNPTYNSYPTTASNGHWKVTAPERSSKPALTCCPAMPPASSQVIDAYLGRHLRPHQAEGVIFMYECIMGLRSSEHSGCLLADEMGLG